MPVLLVTSDRRGAGKTSTVLGLARLSNRSGRKAVAFKPFASGPSDGDAAVIAELANPAPDGWPFPPDAERVAMADLRNVASALADDAGDADLTLVETPSSMGAGGVAGLAESLSAQVLLVSAYRRDLRGADLSQWKESLAERLSGVLVNGVTRFLGTEASQIILPTLDESDVPCLGVIPEDRLMLSVSIEQVRQQLGGRYAVTDGDIDRPLEWFQVGTMSLDPGELRFGLYDNSAAVIRGDRPDMQMSALNGGVACLVLTGGFDPIEYISYEAREEETPVMVVEPDTLSTMALLNDVTQGASMDSASKMERFAALLEQNVDVDRLWSSVL